MENILRFSRPTENQKETIPESIAAQWGPGYFYIIFWKRVALIFYRDIDCQSIVSVSGLSILWSSELAAFRESFTCPSVSGWISFFSTPGNITHSAGLLWNIRPHESRTSVEPSLAFDVLHYQFPLSGYLKPCRQGLSAVFAKWVPLYIACRFLVYGFRSLAIQGIFQYDDKEYIMSEVPRNACQAEYNLYLQCVGR